MTSRPNRVLSLEKEWTLVQSDKNVHVPTTVPGSVFATLLEHRIINDPFDGLNEKKMMWVFESTWIYQCEFSVDPTLLDYAHLQLCFRGIDTFASITLNGQVLGTTENMHREYWFDLKPAGNPILKPQNNLLRVEIGSATKKGQAECDSHQHRLDTGYPAIPGVPYIRKAQYSFGWDWGPQLPDIGIWKPVHLVAWDSVWIASHYLKPAFTYDPPYSPTTPPDQIRIRECILDVDVTVDRDPSKNIGVAIDLVGELISPQGIKLQSRTKIDTSLVHLRFTVPDPALWWIHELGVPHLYTFSLRVMQNDQVLDSHQEKIGLRDLKLIRETDRWGETFYFRLNGVPIFAKGADWVPVDSFIPRGQRLGLDLQLLDQVKAAHMTMLRIWGGGIYESDAFYTRCDELGILLWQDFLFACAPYPADTSFMENVRQEVIQNVIRLRNHPSLAIWVGNNECEEGWVHWGWSIKQPAALKQAYLQLFEQLIPALVKEYDPQRTYWPSSPSSGGNFTEPRSEQRGDSHLWKIWGGGAPFSDYRASFSRFMSEFGFESFPEMRTIRKYCPPDQLYFDSPVMELHQKNRGGNQKIMKYMKNRYGIPKEFPKQITLSQIQQAEAMEYGVEHWRRNRNDYHCMGTLFWQLNDCWPVASWSAIDYFGSWKALQYFAKRFYPPIFISTVESPKNAEIWVHNDMQTPFEGEVTWCIMDWQQNRLLEGHQSVKIAGCRAEKVVDADVTRLNRWGKRKNHLIVYELKTKTGELLGNGMRLFDTPRTFKLLDPQLSWILDPVDARSFRLSITVQKLALYVYFESESIQFIGSDNYFPMAPGTSRQITITLAHNQPDISIEQLKNSLKVRSMVNLR